MLGFRKAIRWKIALSVGVLMTVVVVAMTFTADLATRGVLNREIHFAIGGVLLVLGLVTSYLLGRRVTRPISLLADRATKVDSGSLDTHVRVTSTDEIGQLQQALNDMLRRLARSYGELENRVQKRTAELALERRLLHALMDHHPDVIYFKDLQSCFLRISRALALRLNLADPSQAQGKSDIDFFPEEYAQRAREDEEKILRAVRPLVGKEEHPRWPDGSETWVSTTKTVLRDEDGEIVGTFGISHDITDQKLANEALEQRERQTRLIIDTANDAFVAMDADGRITDWNAQAERTFGWSRDEIQGRRMDETIIPPRYREAHTRGLRHFLETGEGKVLNERIELAALHRDGHEFPIEITIAPLQVEDTYVFNAFIHDISRRKQDEAAIREAKDAAEAANRAKSAFLATMSHEIRTPMNAILGMTELVLDTPLTGQQRDYLKLVQESGESLLTLINDVLDFSKIEAGRMELDLTPFDFYENVGDTMKTLAVRAHAKGLELTYRVAPNVPEVLVGDRLRLRQIAMNLVGNAIKFTPQGEIALAVECDDVDDEMAMLHFTVNDTGIGIAESRREVIFRAFEQADSSTTRQFGGTGLGLAISARLVQMMGGRIWVESELGQGSTFHFTVRMAVSQERPPSTPSPVAVNLQGLKVLVVDDNATNRRILEEVLGNWHMRSTVVASADEALEALVAAQQLGQPFELVLTDCRMPRMDGFRLAEKIRDDPTLGDAIIMMLTSDDSPDGIARCEAIGISDYLMKPVKQSELFDAIVSALGPTVAPEEARAAPPPRAVRCLRILLAEDSFVNQKVAIGLLERYGHTVQVANNGREAVAAVQQQPFDLVLMDVQMPEMDGLEAAETIRQWEAGTGGHISIIAMTAHAMKGDRERCLGAGMDDYVAKPVRSHELLAAIERVLSSGAGAEPGEPAPTAAAPASGEVVDWTAALETAGGDPVLLRELLEAFLVEYPTRLREIQQGLADGDATPVGRAAHTLCGNARYFGAAEMCQAAQRLQTMADAGDLAEAASALPSLEEALARFVTAITTFMEEEDRRQ